ncbi:Arm DNA-binding domain-containing protein [Rhodanobacter sp. C01]|uniref:Arm DNA-binding domain-containing protein n=1 Tax=Rhodanobacter sp. C01 TaxID=1945856 RepID=UPI000987146A|nr:Arm DNA-binding domain-containing protein [Rhodanobacter sp. C01]
MALTDTAIRKAAPRDKPYKLSDGGGMYLEVMPTGAKYWRLKYRMTGKEKRFALGVYPVVSLASARQGREEARKLLVQGVDPSSARQEAKRRVREIRQVTEVSVGPTDRHPLVVAACKRLATGDIKSEKGLISAPAEVLHVEVTRGSLERALDLFNALIFEFAKRGSTVEVDAEKKWTVLIIEGTRVELSVTERVRRKEHVDTPEETKAKERYWKLPRYPGREYPGTPRHDYLATGILTITAGRWPSRSWNDTERTPLERRFPEVVSGLILLAAEIHAREEKQAREAEQRRLAKEHYARIMEQRKRERGLFEALETEATKWERAARLRAYVDAVEHAATLEDELTDELVDWIDWARTKADWLDPMIRVSDLILDAPEPEKPALWW